MIDDFFYLLFFIEQIEEIYSDSNMSTHDFNLVCTALDTVYLEIEHILKKYPDVD